jgi:predicted MPP superfamily phosphohydrolase
MRTILMFTAFLVIMMAIVTGWHYYLGARLISWLDPAPPWRLRLRVALIALGYSVILSRLLERILPTVYCLAWWLAAIWFGFAFLLFMSLVAGHAAEAVLRSAGRWPGDGARRLSVGVPVVVAVVATVVALVQGLRTPRLVDIEVPIPGLPAEADGLKLVQISDLHIGAIVGLARTRALVDRVNALQPDVILVTGDLIDEHADGLGRFEDDLKRLSALRGVFAITGNHEYIHGVEPARSLMKRVGMHVLCNEAAELVPGLLVVGLEDPTGRSFGAETGGPTTHEVDDLIRDLPRERPCILLYHQPVDVERFAALGVDLMLSGHTHVGQIWPFGLIQKLVYPRNHGRYDIGGMTLYVSSGAGTWGPPMRLFTRSELVAVTLRAQRVSEREHE